MAAALRAGRLGGAALDVFEQEPLRGGSPLAGCPQLLLTPHIAGVTRESNERVSTLIAEKVADALARRLTMTDAAIARRRCASSPLARCSAPARRSRDGARRRAAALVGAEAQGLASHGVARVAQYAAHLRNGRADGNAAPRVVARSAAAPCWSMRAAGSRFRRARWRSTRRSAARASSACRSPASPTAIISASRRGTCGRSRRRGMVGLAFGNSPAAMPAAGGKRAAVRHQSDRRRLSAPRRRRR